MEVAERDPMLVSQLSAKIQSERAACEAERAAVAKHVVAARVYNEKIRAEFMARREERATLDKAVLEAETRAHGARKALAQAEVKEAVATAVVEHKNAQQEQLAGFINLLHQQERQLKDQQQQVIEAQAVASKYKFECSDLMRDLGNLRDSHEKESSKLRSALDVSKGELIVMQRSLEEAKQYSAQHENNLRAAATSAKSETTSALGQVEDLRRELREAKARLLAGEREMSVLRSEASVAKNEAHAALQRSEALQRGYNEAEQRIACLHDEANSKHLVDVHPKSTDMSAHQNPQQSSAPRRNRREVSQMDLAGPYKDISTQLPRESVPATSSTALPRNEAICAGGPNDNLKTAQTTNVDASTIALGAQQRKEHELRNCEMFRTSSPQEMMPEQHKRNVGLRQQHLHQGSDTVFAIESKSIIVRSSNNVALDHSKMTALDLNTRCLSQGNTTVRNFDQIIKSPLQRNWFEEDGRLIPKATGDMGTDHSVAFVRQQLTANMQHLQCSDQRWQQRTRVIEGEGNAAGEFDLRSIIDTVAASSACSPSNLSPQREMANHLAVSRFEAGMPPRKRPREADEWIPPTASSTASCAPQRCTSGAGREEQAQQSRHITQSEIPSQPVQRVQLGLQEQQQLRRELERDAGAGGRRPKRSKSKVERLAHMLYSKKPQAHQLRGAPLKLYQAHVDHVLERWDRYEQLHQPKQVSEEQRGECQRQHAEQRQVGAPQVQLQREQLLHQQPRIFVASGR